MGIISSFPTEVDVILVEWHHVSMQLESHVPSIDATVKSICNMLDSYSHTQAWYADFHCMLYTFTCICIHTHLSYVFVHTYSFVAHSMGNNALSWMLKREYSKQYVGSTVMLDPITILLCDNKVGMPHFLYKH